MRALVQRVDLASVLIGECTIASINKGLVVFLGISKDDCQTDAEYIVNKIINLRVFPNTAGQFDISTADIESELLVVSQFTLYGDTRKGNRPSFTKAAKPSHARQIYDKVIELFKATGLRVQTGMFGEHMLVDIRNNGPVTFIVDSRN